MKSKLIKAVALLALLASPFIGSQAIAAGKSFADAKIVLQISDPNPLKQTLVLNVADNLKKLYGKDLVDVEIVAFGPGLRLLQKGNANSGRIKRLVGNGVQFSACAQTMKKMKKILGHQPELNSNAKVVDGGVVRILELIKKGYVLIKP
jgi:intracellular sulfur oxidation DsrE/DsrF family protein